MLQLSSSPECFCNLSNLHPQACGMCTRSDSLSFFSLLKSYFSDVICRQDVCQSHAASRQPRKKQCLNLNSLILRCCCWNNILSFFLISPEGNCRKLVFKDGYKAEQWFGCHITLIVFQLVFSCFPEFILVLSWCSRFLSQSRLAGQMDRRLLHIPIRLVTCPWCFPAFSQV